MTYDLRVSVGEILQGGCSVEDWNKISGLTETIYDASSDHDAGQGELGSDNWHDFENGW